MRRAPLWFSLILLASCASTSRSTLPAAERKLIDSPGPLLEIVTWDPAKNAGHPVLRQKARSATGLAKADLTKLDRLLRATLEKSGGVGLAAPQVGLPLRVFLVQLQDGAKTVITCVDPVIEVRSEATVDGYEGCLSIPGVGGKVRRHEAIQVRCLSIEGRVKIYETSGFEARIFQHEYDHLEGRLYTDVLDGELMPIEEMRRRRAAEDSRAAEDGK